MPDKASYSTAILRIIAHTGEVHTLTVELEGTYEDLPAVVTDLLLGKDDIVAFRLAGGSYAYIDKNAIAFAEISKGRMQ